MKKLYISVPMKGRTEENIRKTFNVMHNLAETFFGERLEVIPTYIEDKPPKTNYEAVWYLGESIKKLSEADYFIGFSLWRSPWKGCETETDVAEKYDVPNLLIETRQLKSVLPDIYEAESNYHRAETDD